MASVPGTRRDPPKPLSGRGILPTRALDQFGSIRGVSEGFGHRVPDPGIMPSSAMAYEPTPEQRLILEHAPDRHGRVLAGPGTGKSATVVDLIHRLLARDDGQPRIRLLTFTRAATAELAGKVAAHEAEVERPSTVHSFAIGALLRNQGSAPFPEPLRLADDWELDKIIRPELAALTGVQTRFVKRRLLPEMAAMWQSLVPEKDPEVDEATRNRFIGAFRQHRRVMGYTLLGELPDLLRQALESYDDLKGLDYDLLVVDEYQDLNACDLRVLKLLAERGVAIFAVGDDEQSIYGWRKAAPEGIRRFPEDYAGADDYVLSISHRCGAEIIRWARFVIEADPGRPPERGRLVPADGAPPGEVALLSFPSQITEARGVADLVQNLIEKEDLEPSEILVMSRGDFNGQFSRPIKTELDSRGISVDDPSWVDEVVTDAGNRAVLLLARLMVSRSDSLAWPGLTVLEPGIGSTFRRAIYDRASEAGTTFAEALLAAHADDFDGMTGAAPKRAKELIDRTLVWLDANPVPEEDDDVPERWGDWLRLAFSGPDAPAHVSDALAELLRVVDDVIEPDADLPRFLGQIQPLAKDHASAQASGARFLTMGLSKGLTVEASIIVGAEEGIIPDPRADEDEERRLLYVGLTRAKRFSYATWATRRTGPTARAGTPRVHDRRLISRLLRGGPVETQNGQVYVRHRWG
jgi:DNA helicase-2/ATP-dependent DNA helicase PcrA